MVFSPFTVQPCSKPPCICIWDTSGCRERRARSAGANRPMGMLHNGYSLGKQPELPNGPSLPAHEPFCISCGTYLPCGTAAPRAAACRPLFPENVDFALFRFFFLDASLAE